MKIAIIVGTRPEVIKMSSLIKECERNNIDFFVIHSNQHYSPEMDSIFFDELNLPSPKYNLGVGSGTHSNQTGNILIKMDPIFEQEKPDIVLVQGDTNTVLAGALAAAKIPNCKLGHIEAGLRSYDRAMPEETNRVVTDHMSTHLFAVTNTQKEILLAEGIAEKNIYIVGNTVVDALLSNVEVARNKSKVLKEYNLNPNDYFLVTAHRSSNVDTEPSLLELFELFNSILENYKYDIVWPIHPRTKKNIEAYGIEVPRRMKLISPQGYINFLQLQANAKIILTDSGGIQEEACCLNIPCITLRQNTERPETIDAGASILVGRDKKRCIESIDHYLNSKITWSNPFGDGTTANQILKILGLINE